MPLPARQRPGASGAADIQLLAVVDEVTTSAEQSYRRDHPVLLAQVRRSPHRGRRRAWRASSRQARRSGPSPSASRALTSDKARPAADASCRRIARRDTPSPYAASDRGWSACPIRPARCAARSRGTIRITCFVRLVGAGQLGAVLDASASSKRTAVGERCRHCVAQATAGSRCRLRGRNRGSPPADSARYSPRGDVSSAQLMAPTFTVLLIVTLQRMGSGRCGPEVRARAPRTSDRRSRPGSTTAAVVDF